MPFLSVTRVCYSSVMASTDLMFNGVMYEWERYASVVS